MTQSPATANQSVDASEDDVVVGDSVPMNSTSFRALTDAHEHARRALTAISTCEPFDSIAMIRLDAMRAYLREHIAVLDQLKKLARVTE